jgi:hypothetical protein
MTISSIGKKNAGMATLDRFRCIFSCYFAVLGFMHPDDPVLLSGYAMPYSNFNLILMSMGVSAYSQTVTC